MTDRTQNQRFRFWLWLIGLVGVIVPRRLRADWRQEWEAELQHREELLADWDRLNWRNKVDLLWRSTSAFWDALCLQTYRWEDAMIQDLRFAVRMLLKNKSFTAIATLTLALGIGANTAIFSVVDAVLLKLLPVKNPEELVALDSFNERREQRSISHPLFEKLRERTAVLPEMFAASDWTLGVDMADSASGNRTENVQVQFVSGEYFEVLGVNAVAGRTLTAGDDRSPGQHPMAVLSYLFWQRAFSGNSAVIGQGIMLKGEPFTIIGVAPRGFFGEAVGRAADIWVPLTMQPVLERGLSYIGDSTTGWLRIMARLQPGTSAEQAEAALAASLEQIKGESTRLGRSARGLVRIGVFPGEQGLSEFRERYARPLKILMAVVGLVLLIACANVANLQLARATSRQKEVAIRMAIGAGRLRLIRQFGTESVLLALGGGALGYYFAEWGTRVLLILGSDSSTPLPIDVTPNSRILGFTLAISLLAAILFGLAPALIVTGQDVNSALKASSVARPRLLLSRPLVVGQVALSLLLLTGAGLFVRTLLNLRTLDLGFAAEHVVQARVSPQTSGYKREQYADLYRRLHERLQSAPGVSSASLSASGFLAGSSRTCCIAVEGYFHQPEENREVQTLKVTPGYFETMGVPLLMGRDFASSDVPSKPGESPKVAIINETMSRYYFGDANPLGRRFGWGDGQVKYEFEIVGVAKDAIYGDLRNRTASLIYFPSLGESLLVVRASSVSASLLETIRREIQKVDQNLEISSILTIPQLMDQALVQERLLAKLSGFFGLLALLLASIGLYGVRSYDVTRRTREIGIRMALGAGRRQVSRMVLRETLWLVSIGLAIGLAASLVTARLIASLLFGVTDKDPLTMALAAMLLLAVAAFAGWLPARRASRVDPMVALRHE